MKKSLIFSMTTALMMGTVALSSCSNDELPVGNEAQIANGAAKTYSFSVSAVMDDEADTRVFEIGESTIKSFFSTSEKVYVYIKRGDVIAYGNLPLTPSNVSPDGQSCTLDTPKDFYFISETPNFAPEVDDEVYLYYGMDPNYALGIDTYYSFRTYGTKEDVEKKDFCLAEMVVTGVDKNKNLTFGQKDNPTKTNFSFTNINSIFRQKVTFKDYWGTVVTPDIQSIDISLKNGSVAEYRPFVNSDYSYVYTTGYGLNNPDLTTDGNIYFSTIFTDKTKNDSITITATDTNGIRYVATKPAPKRGFENNKYYNGDVELRFDLDNPNIVIPTFLGNTYEPSYYDDYASISAAGNFTISGIGQNVRITVNGMVENHNITLDNLIAKTGDSYFIIVTNQRSEPVYSTLNLKGNNVIMTNNGNFIRYIADYGNLKLKCEGDKATLTFKTKRPVNDGKGGFESHNVNYNQSDAEFLEAIAAEGYTVELSSSDFDDLFDSSETYDLYDSYSTSWTYTVKKIKE